MQYIKTCDQKMAQLEKRGIVVVVVVAVVERERRVRVRRGGDM